MTKPGYTHIIVPTDLHQRLKTLASQNGMSIAQLVAAGINTGINTRVNPNIPVDTNVYAKVPTETEPIPSPFSKTEGSKRRTVGSRNQLRAGPAGFEPATPGLGGRLHYPNVRSGLLEYVKRYDTRTAACMVSYLDRYVKDLQSPMDVIMLFNERSIGQQHHLNRALRCLFNFCEIIGYSKAWLDGLRKAIPKDEVGVDLKVPEESEVIKDLHHLGDLPLRYRALWSLCLDSGIRLIEGLHLINEFSEERLQKVHDFYRYEIAAFRGSKQAYYAYFTDSTLQLIKGLNGEKITRLNASHYINRAGFLAPKYLRKFAFDKMITLEIPESVADFIEGRVPKRIGAKHYMVLMRQADKFYGKYAEYMTALRSKAF